MVVIFSHNWERGTIASGPASPPAIKFPLSGLIPNAVGCVIIPPFLYHSIENLGSEPFPAIPYGACPPLTLMCGRLRCGSDHLKLNAPLILSSAPVTTLFAASSLSLNACLIFPRTFVTAVWAAFSLFVNALVMEDNFPPVNVSTVLITLEKVLCTPAIAPATTPLMPPPALSYADFMASSFAPTFALAVSMRFPAVSLTLLNASETLAFTSPILDVNLSLMADNFPPVRLSMNVYPAV